MTLVATAGALVLLMAITFAVGVRLGRHSVIDVAWGTGIALVAVVALVTSVGHGLTDRRVALLVTAVIWGLRLAVHISRRRGEDPRYRDLLARAPGNKNAYALRVVYLPQALILWLACLPIQAGMYERVQARYPGGHRHQAGLVRGGVPRPGRGRAPVDRPHQGQPVHSAQGLRARLRLRRRHRKAQRGHRLAFDQAEAV
jgi:Protein of unknown function (DUF1295)